MKPNSEAILERRLAAWAEAAGSRLCVLFGSRAGAEVSSPDGATANRSPSTRSDVDIAIQFRELPPPERRLELIGEAQDICGAAMADVVFLHLRTDPVLRFEIFRSGRPVFEAEEGAFIDEKVRALMLYEDALPFRRMLRERLREDAKRLGWS
ncbi:MAG: nucleotidyltransferase domain-containing protein [Gemmatimonadota bacterium]